MQNITIANEAASSIQKDRATIVIRAAYQEFDPPNVASVFHAYDFLNPAPESPWQTAMRVSPGERKAVNIGHLEWGRCMLIMATQLPKIAPGTSEDLKKIMESNTITITNADGVVVGILRPRRATVVEYPFPVFVQSSKATALLNITAFPVTNDEEIPAQ